ncbi:MAG: thiol:disulfide interchange protein DsbA/DsbL [Betaproteobacteria bacterium]|nr:thiol:disulfide interchange protein DsbA/DsbL [Betaproteobacteria bacterium]
MTTNFKRRILLAALAAIPFRAQLARAQAGSFTELKPPQPVETGNKIEVVEFFWYGCPHCYNLEPLLETWLKKQPPDVEFRRIPAVFNERWALDAGMFFTLEALGVLEKLHRPLFDAIHRDRLRTDDVAARDQWLQKNGVDPKKFEDTFRSFGVQSKVKRAAQQTIAYKIDGTPAMAVQGRYTVSVEQGNGQAGMLAAVDRLVDQVRKRKAG